MSFIPLSLYIHMPWCIQKCPYCNFNSHARHSDLPEESYIKTLIDDLEQRLSSIDGRLVHSIFIGGGTPSLFSATAYQKLLRIIKNNLPLENNIEITLEANPGTVDQERFSGYREVGINRLSIGVQSFQDDKLKTLGRIHNAAIAKHAVQSAKRAGFGNINIDLMFGLPTQTIKDALHDLQMAIDLSPTHLSWYQLTLEPNTFFYKHPPALPTDDRIWEIQAAGQQLLHRYGFHQYEISAYCRDNYFCKHNINYWEFGDYVGIGAGAHSKLTMGNKITRSWNVKNPRFYMDPQRSFIEDSKNITAEKLPLEFMMNALRLQKPIPSELFITRTGLRFEILQPWLKIAQERELLKYENQQIIVLPLGHCFLNELLILF